MIDPMLFMGIETDTWHLDINIINGGVEMVPEPQEKTTEQQRKGVLAYQAVSTIPGDWDRGVNWTAIIGGSQVSMADAMMEVQQAISQDMGMSADQSFTVPIINRTEQGSSIQLLTVSTDDLSDVTLGG